MQVLNPNAQLRDLVAGDTAILPSPTPGHGSVVGIVKNYPSLPANEVCVVYLQDFYLEPHGELDAVYKVPYQAIPG